LCWSKVDTLDWEDGLEDRLISLAMALIGTLTLIMLFGIYTLF
jgi:hypothetical protein